MFPFLPEEVARKEIQLYKAIYTDIWGTFDTKGMFPSEIGFSERMIPYLVDEGIEWVYVANSHISRTIPEWSEVAVAGTDYATEPPNKADQTYDPAPGNYHWRKANIDGRKTCNELTYAYRPHYARYIDPETGSESKVIVVPAADYEGYVDGYQTFPVDLFDEIAYYGDPAQPPLVILAHDGDNAWGGGYDSYMTNTPQKADGAAAKGYTVSQVQDYLDAFPPDPNDIVHVEDGPWVNADGDFGSPTFSNWNWPWIDSSGLPDNAPTFDPTSWDDNSQYWGILIALTNRVLTAESLSGTPDINKILYPQNGANSVEYAWHYLLGWLDSGHIYYGTSSDFSWLPVVAGNKAADYADSVIGSGEITTPETVKPTIWIPQRFPYNPGELNFGCAYGYKTWTYSPDFYVYTFVYDASGLTSVKLKYRTATGSNQTPVYPDNYLYSGGSAVNGWQEIEMSSGDWEFKLFLDGTDVTDTNPDVRPKYLPKRYWAKISGISNKLVDYYVEATDKNGNVAKSPIQHVWVGSGSGASAGDGSGIWNPENPTKNDIITIRSDKDGHLHWGVNNWNLPASVYWPEGTFEWGDGKAVETPLVAASTYYYIEIGPFNSSTQTVSEVDFVFHYSDDTWSSPDQKIIISTPSEIPSCLITAPQNGEVISGTYTISAQAEDDVGVEKVLFYIDDVCVSTDTLAPYSYNWDTTSSSEGYHTIFAVAFDSASNYGESPSVKAKVNNINDVPEITVLTPISGGVVSGTCELKWYATDEDGDLLKIKIEISSDTGNNFLLLVSSADNSGKYLFDSTGFENGSSYIFKLTAYDGVNSSSALSGIFSISNPTSTIPSISIISPQDGETVSGEVQISAQVFDSVGISSVTFYIDGVFVSSFTSSPFTYVWNTSSISDGTFHKIKVSATNTDGFSNFKEIQVTVNNTSPNSAPTISLSHPQGGEILNGTVEISYSAGDVDGDELYITIKISTDNTNWQDLISNSLNLGYYFWDTTEVSDGAYYLKVIASDGSLSAEAKSDKFSVSNSTTTLSGDINRDGIVDGEDLMLFGYSYGSTQSSSRWNSRADLNSDGKIDSLDLQILKANYGKKN